MSLLGERVVYELQQSWIEAENKLRKLKKGDELPFPEWNECVEFLDEGDQEPIYVSPKWAGAKDCAVFVYTAQLIPLVSRGKIDKADARAHWLQRCGQRFRLEHRVGTCKEIAQDRKRWNAEVVDQLRDPIARDILKWDEPEEQAAAGSAGQGAKKDDPPGGGGKDAEPNGEDAGGGKASDASKSSGFACGIGFRRAASGQGAQLSLLPMPRVDAGRRSPSLRRPPRNGASWSSRWRARSTARVASARRWPSSKRS